MRRATLDGLGLKSQGFDIDIEIIAKTLKKRLRIKEIPASYLPRSYAEGKKIKWIDGIWDIGNIIKYRLTS